MARSPRRASGARRVRWVYGLDDAPPTVAEYLGALGDVWPRLTPREAERVRIAFTAQVARGGDITATRMADALGAIGPKRYIVANGVYGGFAHQIADALGLRSVPRQQWWPALSTSPGHDVETRHCTWRLRPTLRQALRRFGPTRDLFGMLASSTCPAHSASPSQNAAMASGTDGTGAMAPAFDPADGRDLRDLVEQLVAARPGQGAFRVAMLDAYGGRCAVTGCDERVALEAAHIAPFRGEHTDAPENGLLLRADLHLLFDAGLMAVDPTTMRVMFAPALRRASSGYKNLHGVRLRPVRRGAAKPSRDALRAHFDTLMGTG